MLEVTVALLLVSFGTDYKKRLITYLLCLAWVGRSKTGSHVFSGMNRLTMQI